MSDKKTTVKLRIWRQKSAADEGAFRDYEVPGVTPDMSFLEVLDVLNEELIRKGEEPVAFEHDCREGICGSCGMMIDGYAHGPRERTTACQAHMRDFREGERIVVEPFRARAFPVVRDLIVDRSAFDRVMAAGGYVSVSTGSAPEANSLPVPKHVSDDAMDNAECIGCGACVASCRNASAMLFVGARVSQFALLPQGQPERETRVVSMLTAADESLFGNCTNELECAAACPRGVPGEAITRLNREFLRATFLSRKV